MPNERLAVNCWPKQWLPMIIFSGVTWGSRQREGSVKDPRDWSALNEDLVGSPWLRGSFGHFDISEDLSNGDLKYPLPLSPLPSPPGLKLDNQRSVISNARLAVRCCPAKSG